MVIVNAADDRFALPLAVTLYSALANLAGVQAVSIYIIDGGISEENKRKLVEVLSVKHVDVHITWIRPNLAPLNGVKTDETFSDATYHRLLIPELLPQFDRVIYLDSDLVVEKSLHALWEERMDGRPALAVQNYRLPYVSSDGLETFGLSETYQMLGLPPNAPYCYPGVMVMNLKRWREENIGPRALEYCRKFQRFDQDGINAIIAGEWGLLDPKWDVVHVEIPDYGRRLRMSQVEMRHAQEELWREPFIRHFSNPTRPWHFAYRGPAQSRFFYYLKKSGWFGPIEDMRRLIKKVWETQNEYEPWLKRLYVTSQELGALIPAGDSFILVDQNQFWFELLACRRSIPFLERDGRYWGSPPDDATAIRELERLRQSGAGHIVFAWPAFWWLDYYHELNRYLRSSFRCVLDNERAVVFDLRP